MYIKEINEIRNDNKNMVILIRGLRNANIKAFFETEEIDNTIEGYIGENMDRTNKNIVCVFSDENVCLGFAAYRVFEGVIQRYCEIYIEVAENAKGRGYAWFLLCECLKIIFEEDIADSAFGYVNTENARALSFFRKHHIYEIPEDDIIKDIKTTRYLRKETVCFSVLKGDRVYLDEFNSPKVKGCRIIHISTIPTVEAGELSFFEQDKDYEFSIRRIYYITKVPEGIRRGFHAHKKLKQILFCPHGKIQILLDDGTNRDEIILNDPSRGIIIDQPLWREILWLEKDSVLCVAASENYSEFDYMRDYESFKRFLSDDS